MMNTDDLTRLWTTTLSSGMKVAFYTVPEAHEGCADLNVAFGAKDRTLETLLLPAGTAHFLEHKTFTREDGSDAALAFDALGLAVNAQTGYDATEYFFSGATHLKEGLALLLGFVLGTPRFTKENVDRERAIISQEIAMYEDDPASALSNGLMRRLFRHYYYIDDIAGTQDGIKAVTPELLAHVHEVAYVPANMTLTLHGAPEAFGFASKEELRTGLESLLPSGFSPRAVPSMVTYTPDEGRGFGHATRRFNVNDPLVIFGARMDVSRLDALTRERQAVLLASLMGSLYGFASPLAGSLRDEGIVLGAMSFSCEEDEHYLVPCLTARSPRPAEARKRIEQAWKALDASTLDRPAIAAHQAIQAGSMIRERDSALDNAMSMASRLSLGLPPLARVRDLEEMSEHDLQELLSWVQAAPTAFYTLLPRS